MDLRKPLREGASKEELMALIRSAWTGRRDRGAEERLLLKDRSPLVQITELKAKPHLEMHTRGG
jgi:cyclic pyranopterin phosphate synthase